MKRKLRMVLAGVLAVASLAMTAGAASYDNCADRLSDLGLFQGTGNGYQLDRAPTRAEAATMLVRLLGAEAEAEEWTIPRRSPIWTTGRSPMCSTCMITA